MGLINLINRESPFSVKQLAGMAVLSGLANAMVLAVINSAASSGADSFANFRYVILFGITVMVYVKAQSFLMVRSALVVEGILYGMRLRVIGLIRRADVRSLEQIGRSPIYSAISGELASISQATTEIVTASQASIMVAFSISYLAVLSWPAFFITLVVSGIGISIHFRKASERQADIHESIRRETGFVDLFTELLDGFNEAKVNRRVGEALEADLRQASNSLRDIKIRVSHQFSGHFIFSQAIFYLMIACIVFLLPRSNLSDPMMLTKTTATILFIIGPLTSIMAAIPTFTLANVAISNIHALEERLAGAVEVDSVESVLPTRQSFQSIALRQLSFQYLDETGQPTFKVGPLDLEIKAGETLFIVGGNGSGKSTFLRLLTALYYPPSDAIMLDGVALSSQNLQEYRNLFSIIFTDYHIFSRIYGMDRIDPEEVQALLTQFELEQKIGLVDGNRWTSTSLSTGQRKRIALIVSIVQQKPIIVFDEWAADQDPIFRRYFYEVLLPELKASGRTIIAATHDDRYFHLADRVMRMEFGQLEPWDGGPVRKTVRGKAASGNGTTRSRTPRATKTKPPLPTE